MMASLLLSLIICLLTVVQYGASDYVIYNLKTQAVCTEVTRGPTANCVWAAGLNSFADQIAEGGRITAYKIRWFSGRWSYWLVPGVNDMDIKYNIGSRHCPALATPANTMRRYWSYFYDHTHKFIICKPK